MKGVYTVFILMVEDCSGTFVTNACNVVLHYVWALLHTFKRWLDKMELGKY